jgi:hypothetical protein
MPMTMSGLPLHTWMVVEQHSSKIETPISMHTTQRAAEAERDKRNQGLPKPRYGACIIVEPVAHRMSRPHH